MQELWQFDLGLFRAIHLGLRNPVLDIFFLVITYTGIGQTQLIAIFLSAIYRKTRAYAGSFLAIWVISGLLNNVIKRLVDRDRPSLLEWAIPQEPHQHNSFPSGHSVTSFAIAFLVLFHTWPTPYRKWGWVAVAWATLVGISRIYRGVHWPTDVIGAMALGLITAGVLSFLSSPKNVKKDDGI